MIKTKICPICGITFATSNARKTYCNKDCTEQARIKRLAKQKDDEAFGKSLLPPEPNLKIGKILAIMDSCKISYSQYALNNESRAKYIKQYKEGAKNVV